ncbi:MAG: FHA domain-containing protein [Ardenticatenaceae bacterium]|nr:FHA domain-containing protein [Anaerolineales bacterium]MCB8920020.1 FHA domain-containing protein [Ardenticatenaceae bacterium]MCB8989865.1 FHA domain-containing protein [Ardenticatenaceae bacterium]
MDEKPVLIAREGQFDGQQWTIDTPEFTIGRGSDCQVILPERQVSRYHAKIWFENGRYLLEDLESKNGTHLNGGPVEGKVPLQDGDEISIALAVKLVFVGTDATVPLTFDPPKKAGNLTIDQAQRTISIQGQELEPPLSLAQFRLLELLYEADGAVCSRDAIVDVVWPGTDGLGVSEQAIDALVRRLRDRLTELDEYNYVVTVRGHGFRLDNEPH